MTANRLSRLDTQQDLLFYRLSRVAVTAGSMVVRLCEGQYGITRREWRYLGLLATHGQLPSNVLAEKAKLDKAITSRILASLVQKGLVERQVKASDRRQAELMLTEAGTGLYEQLMPQARSLNRELLDELAEDEVAVLDGLLERLQRRADAMVVKHGAELPKTMRHKGGRANGPLA